MVSFKSFLTSMLCILTATTVSVAQNITSATVKSTILVLARDAAVASSATSGLNGYGIPYQVVLIPQTGIALPALSSGTTGNYGGIIVEGQISYDMGGGNWQSAITPAQWQSMYDYQVAFGVRMVQFDVYPQPMFGTTVVNGGGCCDSGVEQLISFTDTSAFPQAGIKTGAGMTTQGLWHYNAQVTDTTTTKQIAQFGAGGGFPASTAAVINNFSGRQQMVFFISWATEWSQTSNFLQHAYITWMTRGIYTGYRRVNLNTQIDDVFLETEIYGQTNVNYRSSVTDMNNMKSWITTIRNKMSAGSTYYPELGHNGNGAVDAAAQIDWDTCEPGPIYYDWPGDTALEFQKPLGTGTNKWPTTPTTYQITNQCVNKDPLEAWFKTASNRNQFMHISHTHTHLALNNATYADALKEIQFNQAWFQQIGITGNTNLWSPKGLIPPAITGLHNGDVLKAWTDAGLTHCVGDNSRPVLRNTQNQMWPYTTQVSTDGFAGYTVIPRWATRIYFNCDTADCTTAEWINTSAGQGTFTDLLNVERSDTMRRLFGLFHDGFMFHQANMRVEGLAPITVNGVTSNMSIFQAWVEVVVQEFTRLVNWPLVTLKQDDLATSFRNRQARDACGASMQYTISNNKITALTLGASTGNSCSARIPITIPAGNTVTATQGSTSEKLGADPQTYWVQLSGAAKTFTLSSAVNL
jgi:hypothetical protein